MHKSQDFGGNEIWVQNPSWLNMFDRSFIIFLLILFVAAVAVVFFFIMIGVKRTQTWIDMIGINFVGDK